MSHREFFKAFVADGRVLLVPCSGDANDLNANATLRMLQEVLLSVRLLQAQGGEEREHLILGSSFGFIHF